MEKNVRALFPKLILDKLNGKINEDFTSINNAKDSKALAQKAHQYSYRIDFNQINSTYRAIKLHINLSQVHNLTLDR